jgi:hypothetical protein
MRTLGTHPRIAGEAAGIPKRRGSFYLLITSAMACTVFLGFSFTYFGPMTRGVYPEVSPLVHVHGWTFFAWYLLLPLQAGLIRTRNVSTHRNLGMASAALGALMIPVGLTVSLVQIDKARAADGNPFWQLMGVPIFGVWILFTIFYLLAMHRRQRVEDHKRYIILASAVALSAATFRIVAQVAGFSTSVAVVGTLACVIFPIAAIIHDRRTQHGIHPVYAWGVPAILLVIGGSFLLGVTPLAGVVSDGLGWIGGVIRPLYVER